MSLAKLLQPRITELGKVKIGGLGDERTSRSGNKYRVPEKWDHFVITTNYRDAAGRLVEDGRLMASLKGVADEDGQIRSLPISLLSNDIEEVLQASYLWYDGKRLAAKSDGETLTAFCDMQSRTWLAAPKVMPWKAEYADIKDAQGNARFKLHATLNVVIASPEARWGGFYRFRTTSRITSDQLYGSLLHLRQLTGGILRGLPLRLVVRPLQVSPQGKPTTVYVVHVELQGSDVAAIQRQALELAQFEVSNAKQLAAAQAEYRQLLRAPDEFLDADEEAEVGQEFAPHQQPGVIDAPAVVVHATPTPQPAPQPEATTPPPRQLTDEQRAAIAREVFADCTGLTGLTALVTEWNKLPASVQKLVEADKNRRKAELTAPPPAPKPTDTDLEHGELLAQLGSVCEDAGTSPAAALRQHWHRLGYEQAWFAPKMPDHLTSGQLQTLIGLVGLKTPMGA